MHGVLALDQGSHASRACVFDAAGVLRASAQVSVSTRRPAGHIEQDPLELAHSLRTAATQCLAQVPTLEIRTAGLATQRSSIVCAQRATGRPLSAVLSWQDRRNAAWLRGLQSHEEQVRGITGLPLSPHYGASKMRWCLDHLPAVHAAAGNGDLLLAPLAAWLVAQLTGGPARVDPANAARTMLWDSATLDWSPPLLQLFGVDAAWLPDCAATHADYGPLLLERGGIELRACTGDQSAVPFVCGAPDLQTLYINLGTGAFIQRPLAARPVSPAPLLGSVLSADARQVLYSLEGTVNGGGAAVSLFAESQQMREADLWRALETLPDNAALPLYVNGVGGLGSPWWRAEVDTRFIGDGNTLERFAAVVESVVILIAANFRHLSALQPPIRRALLMGGMSRSNWLCRRLAAALGVNVERVEAEATARGAAALAAPEIAAGWTLEADQRFEPATLPGFAARTAALLEILG